MAKWFSLVEAGISARQAFRRWRERRRAKQEGNGMLKEIIGSLARHFTPFALTALGAIGLEVDPNSDPTMLIVAGGLAYVVMQAWSLVRKWRNKPRAT